MIRMLVLAEHAVGINGAARNVVSCLNALSVRNDIRVRLLCGKIDQSEPYARSGRLDIRSGFDPRQLTRFGLNLWKVLQAVRGCDLIYVPAGLRPFLYAYTVKRGRKLVAGPHMPGIPILGMDRSNPSPLITMKMSDAWIEVSEVSVRHRMMAGTPREYMNIVPHAVDPERFNPRYADRDVWRREGLDPNTKKIVNVGRMNIEKKGIPQLIEAYQLIRYAFPRVDLVLIGEPGPFLAPEHRALHGVYPIGPRYGYHLVRLLASADLFMGASRLETFWLAPLEAMACGVAVVVSKTGAVPTMIPQDGVQGRAIEIVDRAPYPFLPDAAERLAAAAIPLLVDDETRHRMGATGREHVISEFPESRLGDRLVRVFQSTIEGGSKSELSSPAY